jgi:hypothetical protein
MVWIDGLVGKIPNEQLIVITSVCRFIFSILTLNSIFVFRQILYLNITASHIDTTD